MPVDVPVEDISHAYDVYNEFINEASRKCEKVIRIAWHGGNE